MSRKRVTYRPSRPQSILGAVAGGLFVLLGIFVVIPTFGPFGVIWTLIAGGILVVNCIHGFGRTYMGPQIEIEDDAPEKSSETGGDVKTRMEQLEALRQSGLITDEEYQKKREQILRDL